MLISYRLQPLMAPSLASKLSDWKCNDFSKVRSKTDLESRFSLTHYANKSSRWSYLLSNIRRLASAVKQQRPLVKWASLRLLRVEDDEQFPASSRVLGPRLCRHERPLGEPGSSLVVSISLAQKHRPLHRTSYRDYRQMLLFNL